MFDVHGDEITFRGIKFATIDGKCWPSMCAEAIGAIETMPADSDWVSGEDHHKALDEMEGSAFEDGKEEGRKLEREEAEKEFEEERGKIEEDAFNEGRASGIADSAKVADVAKLDALMAALELVLANLGKPLAGVKDPLTHQRRPAKISEIKDSLRVAIHGLTNALSEFKSAP